MSKVEKVTILAEPIITALGYDLYDVELVGKTGSMALRVYIDKPDGVSIDDCAAVSRRISLALDAEDVIDSAFVLEVSSPGLTRTLKKPSHYMKSIGRLALLKLRRSTTDQSELIGRIESADESAVTLRVEESEDAVTVNYTDIAKAKLEFEEQ